MRIKRRPPFFVVFIGLTVFVIVVLVLKQGSAQRLPDETTAVTKQSTETTKLQAVSTTVVQQLTRTELTREELISADWSVKNNAALLSKNWKQFGDYEINFDQDVSPDVISLKKVYSQQEVTRFSSDVYIPRTPDNIARNERKENVSGIDIVVNRHLGKLYAFFIFGNSHGGGFRKVYESDLMGKNAHEIESEQGEYASTKDYCFSPDNTKLSYTTNESESVLDESTNTWYPVGGQKIYFHIIDLVDPNRSIKLLLPRNSPRTSDINWVAAWRFADENNVEFTRYFAQDNEADSYTQVSDKELWSYNNKTGKLTFLETIPFKGAPSLPVNTR
jgi:hypothetical protein